MKKVFRMAAAVICIALLIIPQTGCASKGTEPVSDQNFFFDTVCQITIYDMQDMSEDSAHAVIGQVFDKCREYEDLLSKTVEGSDIWNINHAGGKPVTCDDITIHVIESGLEFCEMTSGRFDITIGKVTDLYNFHDEDPVPPTEEQRKEALKYVDYHQVKIDGNTVTMGMDQGEIDLGAIAKGYIADRIADQLKEAGVTSAIINLGGNVECVGDKAGTDFKIGIEKPYSNQAEIVGATPLSDGTVVTSGTYERYYEYDGVKYHHIIDTETGLPVVTDVVGVSIKGGAGQSELCDGLSTTCLILGKDEAMKLVESIDGVEALFILEGDEIQATDGFQFEPR